MTQEMSRTVKAGKRTYFFDVKEAKTGDKYLVITESRFRGEGQERERSTVMVFSDTLEEFVEAFHEIVKLV